MASAIAEALSLMSAMPWLQNCTVIKKGEMRIQKTVLLVDDDMDDLELLQEALRTIDGDHKIIEAGNGEEGLGKLNKLMADGELPCLIVLDLNMPKMDGRQTFLAIKADSKLSHIPVVIFSTSTSLLDRIFFERHHTAYFIKPVSFSALASTASKMITHCQHRAANSR
jgi:CheY-like chemotaxis protein